MTDEEIKESIDTIAACRQATNVENLPKEVIARLQSLQQQQALLLLKNPYELLRYVCEMMSFSQKDTVDALRCKDALDYMFLTQEQQKQIEADFGDLDNDQ